MDNTTLALIGSISVLGCLGLYFLYSKMSNPQSSTALGAPDFSVPALEAPASNFGSSAVKTTEVIVDHYIPRLITNPEDLFILRMFIFRNDPIACRWLDRYAHFVFTDPPVTRFLSTAQHTPAEVVDMYRYVYRSRPWQGFIGHLNHVEVSDEFRAAVRDGSHVELSHIYREIREVEVKVPRSTLGQVIDFFSSEFGIKCLIAGSIITISAIIIHLLITYYFKTTYTAIAIKLGA